MFDQAEGGLITTFEGVVAPSLRRIARAHSMFVLEAALADRAFEVVCQECPPVIVVQAGSTIEELIEFIRRVANAPRPVPLITVATQHSIRIEQAVLREGARFYVPCLRQALVERLLTAILQRQARGSRMDYRLETARSA